MRNHYPKYQSNFFFEEDNGGNPTGGTGNEPPAREDSALVDFETTTGAQERVEGEKLPDFGSLGKPAAKPSKPAASQPPPAEEKPPVAAPAKAAAPAKGAAELAKVAQAAAEPAKPAAEPPKEPAKPAAKPAAAKPAAKPAAAAPAVEKPAGEAPAELPKVPETDEDLDALKPQAGAPTQVIKSFNAMRDRMKAERATARAALAEVERIRTETAALKESSGKLPPEVEQELEGLRKLSLLTQLEQSPQFQKEFDAKITAAEEGVYGFLQKHGLSAKVIGEIKAAASKAGGDIEAYPRLGELVEAFKNPVDRQEFLNSLKSRRDLVGARSARLAELGESREKFFEAFGKQEEQAQQEFSRALSDATIPLAGENPWIMSKEIPANATAEQKAALEAENAIVAKRVEAFGDYVRGIWARDPAQAAQVSLKAVEADMLREKVETIEGERDKALTQVKELEGRLARVRSAGRLAHIDAPNDGGKAKPVQVEQGIGGDGSAALAGFFERKK